MDASAKARITSLIFRILSGFGLFERLGQVLLGTRITAVATLTYKSVFRYRLVLIVGALLLTVVVGLPLIIKDDGTARGMTQILITYTLGAITGLLGFVTLWLACGSLARDIDECQMQVVVSKPIARWQVWIGKWVGIMAFNAGMLFLCGLVIYVSLHVRAQKLSQEQQGVLFNEVLVGRASVREPMPDYEPEVDRVLQERLKNERIAAMPREFVREELRKQVKGMLEVVNPGYRRRWEMNLGKQADALQGRPVYLRLKFQIAHRTTTQKTFPAYLQVGPPDSNRVRSISLSLADNSFHEIPVPPDLIDEKGVLTVEFWNGNDTALLFPLEEGLEVLYYQTGFGVNFARGLGIVFLWLGLLAALGLAAASYLSFPVAAFVSLSMLIIALFSGTLANVVREGSVEGPDHEGRRAPPTLKDYVLVPTFAVILKVLNLVEGFSPIDALSTGRSITWWQLGRAFAQIGLLVSGTLALVGITLFTRRELALAQSQV